MATARKKRTVPRLASDTARGYVALGVALVPAIAFGLSNPTVGSSTDAATLTATGAFVTWAIMGFAVGVVNHLAFGRASARDLERWMRATEPRDRNARIMRFIYGGGSLSWAISGSIIAVAAVLALSFIPEFRGSPSVVFSGLAVVVGSLFMTVSSFAVRYAREQAATGAFSFAGDEEPRFSDFIYLSVQITTSFSSADVTIDTNAARRLVTAHSLVSFAFNTVIVALLVSVLVSAVG